jgi:O-methyltransferase
MLKKIVEFLFRKRGIRLSKPSAHKGLVRFDLNGLAYDFVVPSANYAPWLGDEEFSKIYKEISGYTLVDLYRCYELWELTREAYTLNASAAFLEVGVWRGGTAAIVGKRLALLGSTVNFYLADTFTGVAKASTKDGYYTGGEHADTSENIVQALTADKYAHYAILKGIFPEDTAHLIGNDQKFSFCHIDVDVFNSARDIVHWIWNKMIVGGIIVFDDYGFHSCDGITTYVNEQKGKQDRLVIHNLNGHAIIIKIA